MSTNDAIAAEWWEQHSNYRNGADYARRIREGDETGLGYGQLAAIIHKGVARGRAAGLTGVVKETVAPKGKGKPEKPKSAS